MKRRIVVTGLGMVSPLGFGGASHWDGLLAGRSAVSRVERLTRLGFPVDVAAEVPAAAFQACFPRLPRKQLKLYNRATVFAMTAATLAVEEAGLKFPLEDPTRAGVILATLFIPYPIQDLLRHLTGMESVERPNQLDMGRALQLSKIAVNPLDLSLKIVPNLTAGHIAINFGLRGFCRTISDGCTGGMQAIGQAMTAIREGDLDVVLCGGAESPMDDLVFADLCSTDLLAEAAEPPDRTCRPFGRGRNGTVAGEGAAVLILEAEEHAVQRGARIRAEVAGFGAAIGELTLAGVKGSCGRAMQTALEDAGGDGVDLVSANGDSGILTDQAEAAALRELCGAHGGSPAIYATKGSHGNLFSATAPLQVATAVMALEHGIVPPSVNCDDPDPECGLRLSGITPEPAPGMRSVLVNAIGAFSESASMVIGRTE
jgi:3-oxoacyl-[acyl-carrier-protein] synthase II